MSSKSRLEGSHAQDRVCNSLLALTEALALAQNTSAYDGKWSATFTDPTGRDNAAEVTISDTAGTWRDLDRRNERKVDKCNGKEFPIDVKARSAAKIVFRVAASTVLRECRDRHVTLRPVDGKTLEGTFADGRSIRLVRQ
jgi:hypothetical protein